MKQIDVVQWYINEAVEGKNIGYFLVLFCFSFFFFCRIITYPCFADRQVAGDEALAAELRLVKSVISRLITKDRVLLVVEDAPNNNPDNRVIAVHPNYHVER